MKRRKITEEDVSFIKTNYQVLGVKKISEHLNRNINVIARIGKKFGLTKVNTLIKYSKNEISDAVKKALNLTEVLKNLLLFSKGGNYKTIKKYIEYYNIDTSHFIKRDYSFLIKSIPLEEILVENSMYSSTHSLKHRLYKEGLKFPICEKCGQDENWYGKKMSLILDHKNGINNDHRIENLRIVCPNCNATLDTHCGKNNSKRNKKKLKYGLNINDKIDFRQINTIEKIDCSFNKRKVKDRPSLDLLLNQINDLGYVNTSKKYNVSDNTIRKWVISYGENPKLYKKNYKLKD